ncbi:universal stress protein [Paramicrobacterium fandaimingii]|uniref:universal stress protein n=1 Tax=Paramicrobacterium fandaimingii TaxID=2708079 RepID=UPI0014229F23|nr:universal stress protein [Microbacterium fandaimingii]
MTISKVVVGWNADAAGEAALEWALERARLHPQPIALLRVVDDSVEHPGRDAAAELDERVNRVRRENPSLTVSARVVAGEIIARFMEVSDPTTLTVVGVNTRGAMTVPFEWTLAVLLAARSHGPVAVIPTEVEDDRQGILVGVDDSESALRAAELAVEEALPSQAQVQLVHAWRPPHVWRGGQDTSALASPHEQLVADFASALHDRHPEITLTNSAQKGVPVDVLLAATPAVVIVGRRNKTAFGRLFLGSVTRDLLYSLEVPVIVVP